MSQWPGLCNYSARMLWNQSSRWRHSWDPCRHRWPSVGGRWAPVYGVQTRAHHQAACARRLPFFNTSTKQERSTQTLECKVDQLEKPKHNSGRSIRLKQKRDNLQMQSERVRGDSSPRALREALVIKHQRTKVPLGMRTSVFWLTSSRPSRSAAWWGKGEWELTPPPGGRSTPSCPFLDGEFALYWTRWSHLKTYNV